MSGLIHIAGVHVQIGDCYLRQRCAWCGAVLIDYDLANIAVPEGQDPTPAVWPHGDLVQVDGMASWTVEHADGGPLPPDACALLDPELTR